MEIKKNKILMKSCVVMAVLLLCILFSCNVRGAEQENTLEITVQYVPVPGSSDVNLVKGDRFYCAGGDGTKRNQPEIYYFDCLVLDGTVFDGYYYSDENGELKAGVAGLQFLPQMPVTGASEENSTLREGYYYINNLGRLSAAPQIRYLDCSMSGDVKFSGFYYFDENGRLDTEKRIHIVDMECQGERFSGHYYFGGKNGRLLRQRITAANGVVVDETGKVENMEEFGIAGLKTQLEDMIEEYKGEWSIYVKDLETDDYILLNDIQMYSASLIKPFMLAKTFQDLEKVCRNKAGAMNTEDTDAALSQIYRLMDDMIVVSDNESFNELVRLQTSQQDFVIGAEASIIYLKREGYTKTSVEHTLHPSASKEAGDEGRNRTSVRDCGILLEKIYKGTCVSEDASQKMLDFLLQQENRSKIPSGIPEGVKCANKTGETDENQHDIAIVYGEETTYILCVMSENCPEEAAVNNIRSISEAAYQCLNFY